MTSAPAIGFEYRRSPLLARLRVTIAVLAVLAIASCGLPVWLKLTLAAGVVVAFVHGLGRPARAPVAAAGLDSEGGWTLRYADGADAAARLASFRVLGTFVLLHLALAGRTRETLLLGPDNSDADIRRRLRMRLALAHARDSSPDGRRLLAARASGTLPRRRGPTP